MVEVKIQWLEPAQDDLRQLRIYYIENAGTKTARRRIMKIMESVSLLLSNPFLGKREQELGRATKEYRFLVSGDYKIYYYVDNSIIKIALLWDCRQNPIKLIDRLR